MTEIYDDAAAARFYENPENLQAASNVVRRRKRSQTALGSHTPIRFNASVIARVKALANEDGLTVSAWIRHLVDRELARRVPISTGSASGTAVTLVWVSPVIPGSITEASGLREIPAA